jgi:hypothetical protein
MKKYFLTFFISLTVCVLGPLAFWRLTPNSKDVTYLLDYLFLSGALFFVSGMITALFATSRLHYYLHLKDKWKGKVQDDSSFQKDEKKRRDQMWLGIVIAFSGFATVVVSGYFALRTEY